MLYIYKCFWYCANENRMWELIPSTICLYKYELKVYTCISIANHQYFELQNIMLHYRDWQPFVCQNYLLSLLTIVLFTFSEIICNVLKIFFIYRITDLQNSIATRCLQLHGGWGYMWEYPIARAFVDSRVQPIYGGSNEIMKELIARTIVSDKWTKQIFN